VAPKWQILAFFSLTTGHGPALNQQCARQLRRCQPNLGGLAPWLKSCNLSLAMPRQTVTGEKHLSPAERKARVDSLVAAGKVTRRQAALIDFREPPEALRAEAAKLVPMAKRALERARRHAA
jgi:hypothetical protein